MLKAYVSSLFSYGMEDLRYLALAALRTKIHGPDA